ncbi:MAG: hypothetical protein KatS3mg002_0483 [Candidatus Woesearchaeota archaeon]|nr:MAG: hypothetical protein KatS3mg002_0483 [Candidatus Woesearchaeota archaeon]
MDFKVIISIIITVIIIFFLIMLISGQLVPIVKMLFDVIKSFLQ